MHFRISSSLSFQRKTKRHVFLLLFVLTPVYLNWPSYATGKCYRSPRQLILIMKHWWLYITIHSMTIFKWKMCNLRLNFIYLSFLCSIYMSKKSKFDVFQNSKSTVTFDQYFTANMKYKRKNTYMNINRIILNPIYRKFIYSCSLKWLTTRLNTLL